MRIRRGLTAACLLAALASPAAAGPDAQNDRARQRAEREVSRSAQRAARAAQRAAKSALKARRQAASQFAGGKVTIEGEDLSQNIERVTAELDWHDELDEARREAVEANKPILYVQALGDLSGLL